MSLIEFFGFGGYSRAAEGYMSWQHLTLVTAFVAVMFICGIIIGKKYRQKSDREKNIPLIITAILIDSTELFKIVILSIRHGDPLYFRFVLPLFLCSIQLITIPLAAFSRGRAKEASLDFVTVFGLLGALLGTYFAGNNFSCYPVISMDNIVSCVTHCLSGFAALYIMISGMCCMKKQNVKISIGILAGFSVLAYIGNIFWDCNYMFLSRGDGTPYDIIKSIVGGIPGLYPLTVVGLLVVYIIVFYNMYHFLSFEHSAKSTEVAIPNQKVIAEEATQISK